MKYAQRDELVSSLRELADFIEDKGLELPELDVRIQGIVYKWSPSSFESDDDRPRRVMRQAAKALGHAQKNHGSYYFDLTRKFGCIKLEISTPRENICEKVVVGKKVIPAYSSPEKIVDEIEWVCGDPLLAS